MKINTIHSSLCLFFFCFYIHPASAQNSEYDEAVRNYIDRFHKIAVKEMMIYHIPASITLAQGIFESNAGRSKLATEANNHFGIKCHKDWVGDVFIQDDETKNECFRKYDMPEESFRDHSFFLAQRDRYKLLFRLEITDYKGWAYGLKEAGYATNPKYTDLIIKIIETYNLSRYDLYAIPFSAGDSLVTQKDSVHFAPFPLAKENLPGHKIYINNGVKFIVAREGETLEDISAEFLISLRKILKYNDLKKASSTLTGQKVYLEKKKRKGAVKIYVVKEGETMYTISQHNGIQLKLLYKRNKIKQGQKLQRGQKLLLR